MCAWERLLKIVGPTNKLFDKSFGYILGSLSAENFSAPFRTYIFLYLATFRVTLGYKCLLIQGNLTELVYNLDFWTKNVFFSFSFISFFFFFVSLSATKQEMKTNRIYISLSHFLSLSLSHFPRSAEFPKWGQISFTWLI